ncbi:hypothetical protein GCM10022235_83990 [Kribbella ginsengisoli]|uniref:Uncharacterized protein n=1 Tax=Kribbella ginsengisoli TaxID=363865 RepID=A0ABP6Z7V7_9ACTN
MVTEGRLVTRWIPLSAGGAVTAVGAASGMPWGALLAFGLASLIVYVIRAYLQYKLSCRAIDRVARTHVADVMNALSKTSP